MTATERREMVLKKAFEYFAEHGLTAQTRALADACGISQRLLYSLFPNKAALIEAVYEEDIAGVFRAVWFAQLRDRSKPLEERLNKFYGEYYDAVLTRNWIRLFLFASLSDVEMASNYISSIIIELLETIVMEAALAADLELPADRAEWQEIAWILHGAISHLAIRRHVYRHASRTPAQQVIALQVTSFVNGLPSVLAQQTDLHPA
jgi:AcrR family transcriptional regulator